MSSADERARSAGAGLHEAVRFQRDLYLYWQCVAAAGGMAFTSRQYVSRPALRRVRLRLCATDGLAVAAEDAAEVDDWRLLFVRRLLERLGLLYVENGRLVAAGHDTMARYLARSLGERLRLSVRVWVAGGWWLDQPNPRIEPPRPHVPAVPRIALARRRLVESLSLHMPGDRVNIPRDLPPTGVRVSRHSKLSQAAPLAPDGTLRAALVGPLTWMGLVEVDAAGKQYATLSACAVLRLPGEAEAEPPETPGRIVIQANFSVVAYPPLTAPALFQLHTCADEVALERIARFRLSRSSLTWARGAGWTAADLAGRLEALSGKPLPGNVRTTLDDWERHVERLRLSDSVVVLEVRERAVLDKLLADRTAAAWVDRRLTETAALIAAGHDAAVRGWLLRHGEMPAVGQPAAD